MCRTIGHHGGSPLPRRTMRSVMLNNCWPMSYVSVNEMSQQDCWVNIHSWLTTISNTSNSTSMANKSIYDFSAETLDGQPVPLSSYRGKVLLIINVATFWGSTIEEVNILPPLINYSKLISSKCLLLCSDCFFNIRYFILCPYLSVPPTECTNGNVWWP